ncbi:unnamed protein product, partial [marine sediment metagenome]
MGTIINTVTIFARQGSLAHSMVWLVGFGLLFVFLFAA